MTILREFAQTRRYESVLADRKLPSKMRSRVPQFPVDRTHAIETRGSPGQSSQGTHDGVVEQLLGADVTMASSDTVKAKSGGSAAIRAGGCDFAVA